MTVNIGSLLVLKLGVEHSVFVVALRVIMNMNKPPDETLKQGRNRSWLLVKSDLT